MWNQTLRIRFPWSDEPNETAFEIIQAPTLLELADIRRQFTGGRASAVGEPDRHGVFSMAQRAVMVSAGPPHATEQPTEAANSQGWVFE